MENHLSLESLNKKMSEFLNEVNKSQDSKLQQILEVVTNNFTNSENLKQSCLNFYVNLNNSGDLFSLFKKKKIKLFSSKFSETNTLSESLFGSILPLKNVFNKKSTEDKLKLWKLLHELYVITGELNNENENANVVEVRSMLNKERFSNFSKDEVSEKVKKDILNVDVNDTTNNMIDDIVSCFQDSMESGSGNPFDSIMGITQKITEKYQSKIESGEIELDKMMGSITSSIPGMGGLMGGNKKDEEKVVIDENFSTDDVELGKQDEKKGFNLSGMMKMMNGMSGGDGGPNLKGLVDVMGKLNSVKTEEEAENLKKEMDSYLESELGVDVSKLNQTINNMDGRVNTNQNNLEVVDETNEEEEQGEQEVQYNVSDIN